MKPLKLCLCYLFHPVECMDVIKRERGRFDLWAVVLLYAAALFSHLLSLWITHYPLQSMDQEDINLALECLKVNGVVFSWVTAAYAISSIMGGEARFTELLTASAYAFVPYILLSPVTAALSQLMSSNDGGLYAALQGLAVGWVVFGLLLSFVRLCDYGFGSALFVGLLSLIFMFLLWGLLVLFLSLCIQAGSFLWDIGREASLKGL